ncbi:hypothetical protein WSM22_45710 [Cytophagales bacterium WSM2-2]|nr:hypothetical protein WSM22_45710 [Cytophagales bacterium WSM2-2]
MAAPIEALFEKAENYGKTSVELLKLNVIDKSADIVSTFTVQFVILTVISFFTLAINIGVALWIGESLGKSYYGFFVVAAFYAIVATVLYFFRHQWIKTPVSNSLIAIMMKQKGV